MEKDKVPARAKGGQKRAEVLTDERKKEIAKAAAVARWGEKPTKAIRKGNFEEDFGINVDCYVINDKDKTAVISQRGMGMAIGLGEGGSRLPAFIAGKTISEYLGRDLIKKIENPVIFQGNDVGAGSRVHGYDVTILIDICNAIIQAESDGKLPARYDNIVKQAHVIVGASAKAGIKGLVYALAGYNPAAEEVIAAFKLYVQEEAKKYEQEFPNELYMQWHRLYQIPVPVRGKPWYFRYLTMNHVYYPLAQSNGKIYELVKALKAKDGDKGKKLFQFLNDVGTRALRMQMGRILEMAESSSNKDEYEAKIKKRFGDQQELELVMPEKEEETPS